MCTRELTRLSNLQGKSWVGCDSSTLGVVMHMSHAADGAIKDAEETTISRIKIVFVSKLA